MSKERIWHEIKHADKYDHSEFHSSGVLIAWWAKDGAWHVAIDRKWTGRAFYNPESAMIAVERGESMEAL